MTSWLRRIAMMTKDIPEDFNVDIPALFEKKEGEEEKGMLSQETTALFRLLNWLQGVGEKITEEHQKVCSSCDESECKEFRRQALILKDDIDTIREVFFSSIRDELKLNSYDCPIIGIRKGGIVVKVPDQKDNDYPRRVSISVIASPGMPVNLAKILANFSKKPN